MTTLQESLLASTLAEPFKQDLVLLIPTLNVIEQLRIKKAIELDAHELLKLIPLKYKKQINALRAADAQVNTGEEVSATTEDLILDDYIPIPRPVIPERPAKEEFEYVEPKTIPHTRFTFDDFSWKKLVEQIEMQRPNTIAVSSILKSQQYLGVPMVRAVIDGGSIPVLSSLDNLTDYRQLAQLDSIHVSFLLDENPDQKLLLLQERLAKQFAKSTTISERRGVFMLFLQSPLFFKYTFTGLTAINLKTDVPRKTLLNVLHQNDDRFLNLSQFEWTAKLIRTIRNFTVV